MVRAERRMVLFPNDAVIDILRQFLLDDLLSIPFRQLDKLNGFKKDFDPGIRYIQAEINGKSSGRLAFEQRYLKFEGRRNARAVHLLFERVFLVAAAIAVLVNIARGTDAQFLDRPQYVIPFNAIREEAPVELQKLNELQYVIPFNAIREEAPVELQKLNELQYVIPFNAIREEAPVRSEEH